MITNRIPKLFCDSIYLDDSFEVFIIMVRFGMTLSSE